MNKEKILEKIMLFVDIKSVKDIVVLLNSSDEIDKFKAIPSLNEFFKVKIKFKDGKRSVYDYSSIIRYIRESIDSSSEEEHILIWRKKNFSDSAILVKDIESYEIDLSSFNLFSSKEELALFCDKKYISDEGIDYIWELYKRNVLPKMKEKEYYTYIKSFSERTKKVLDKINDFPKDKVVTIEDEKGKISKHYFLCRDGFIIVRINKYERPYCIILNKDYYLYMNAFIDNTELLKLNDTFKKLDCCSIKIEG